MPKLAATARTLAGSSLIALAAAGSAHAAALEQTVPATIRLLYQEGRYIEFGVAYTDPDQSGEGAMIPPSPLAPSRCRSAGQHRRRLRGPLELQRRLQGRPERPPLLRADLRPAAPGRHPLRRRHLPALPSPLPASLYDGSMADLKTYQISGVLAYDVNPNVKVYGGAPGAAARRRGGGLLRRQLLGRRRRQVGLRLPARRRLRAPRHRAPGGAHLPLEDLLRPLDTTETSSPSAPAPRLRHRDRRRHAAVGAARLPDRRRAEDAGLRLRPLGRLVGVLDQPAGLRGRRSRRCSAQPRPLVDYADDWWTYNLGVGRQLTDALAGSLSIT